METRPHTTEPHDMETQCFIPRNVSMLTITGARHSPIRSREEVLRVVARSAVAGLADGQEQRVSGHGAHHPGLHSQRATPRRRQGRLISGARHVLGPITVASRRPSLSSRSRKQCNNFPRTGIDPVYRSFPLGGSFRRRFVGRRPPHLPRALAGPCVLRSPWTLTLLVAIEFRLLTLFRRPLVREKL